jgi:hypothetical protein
MRRSRRLSSPEGVSRTLHAASRAARAVPCCMLLRARAIGSLVAAVACTCISRHVHSLHLPAGMRALHGHTRVRHYRRRPMQQAVALLAQRTARLPTRLMLTRHARDRWLVGGCRGMHLYRDRCTPRTCQPACMPSMAMPKWNTTNTGQCNKQWLCLHSVQQACRRDSCSPDMHGIAVSCDCCDDPW